MCAITGWMCAPGTAEPAPETLRAMMRSMQHRGPDDDGEFRKASAALAIGHNRLAIIDLSAASHQPMIDEPTGVVLAYNGELFNFQSLRAELVALGHRFRTSGDTEVVLRSFLQWGTACLPRFAGMFAFALWDPRTKTLHLARDAMGIKPLYVWSDAGRLIFASELKAFLHVPGFKSRVDEQALAQYLEFGYVFDNVRTMLQGVRKLAPGERIEVRGGRIVQTEVWFRPPAPDPADRRGEAERVEELGELMQGVVRDHLIADVPLGLLLSGGLDSSLVGALAAREGPLHTVTMGFGNSVIEERANARAVSHFIGSRHTEIVIEPKDVQAEIETGAWVFDDLFADWGTVSTRLLYRECAKQGLKVVLVGEGADELFGGYEVFRVGQRLGLYQQFRLYQRYTGRRHGELFGAFRSILGDYLQQSGGDAFDAVRLFESRRQLPNQYVMKVDKASMAESVEARAPYLDRRVAELAYRTPAEWLMRGGENKYLLRALARRAGLLPHASSSQEKFGAPLAVSWMDDDPGFRSFAREQLLAGTSLARRLGFGSAMRAYFEEGRSGFAFPSGISIFRNLAWRLLLLELWSRHYLGR